MKNIGKIFWKALKQNLFIWPAMFLGILVVINVANWVPESGIVEEAIQVGFLEQEESPLSENLYQFLSERLNLRVVVSEDEAELKDLLLNTDISGIILVSEGTYDRLFSEENWEVEVITLDDYENAAYLNAYMNTYTESIELLLNTCERKQDIFEEMLQNHEPMRELELVGFEGKEVKSETEIYGFVQMSGIYLMTCLVIGLFIIMTILDDMHYGTYQRMQLSSIKPWQYIIGVALLGIVGESIMAGGIAAYYAVTGKATGISFPLFVTTFILYGIFAVGLSIMIALLVKSKLTALTIIVGYSSIACIWGGAWFPIQENLGILSKTAMLIPTYWFMQIVREGPYLNGLEVMTSLAILVLFTVLTFLISAMVFAKKKG